jgi:hypothetical protein
MSQKILLSSAFRKVIRKSNPPFGIEAFSVRVRPLWFMTELASIWVGMFIVGRPAMPAIYS